MLAGWITTEVGRQPWTIYGVMRTAELSLALSHRADVLDSLVAYMMVYLMMFPTGIAFMAGLVRAG